MDRLSNMEKVPDPLPENITRYLESGDIEMVNLGVAVAEAQGIPWRDIVYHIPMWISCTLFRHRITGILTVKAYRSLRTPSTTMADFSEEERSNRLVSYESVFGKSVVHYG
jgi:hypothetical protein